MNLDLIDDETLEAIPEGDPGYAFVCIERACRKTMLERTQDTTEGWFLKECQLDYMHDVLAAAQYYDIPNFKDLRLPTGQSFSQDAFDDFSRRVRFFTMHFRLSAKTQRGSYSVELQGTHKERIRALVHHLKEAIDRADLTEKKRAELQKRVRDFEEALEGKRLGFAEAMVCLSLLGSGLHGIGDGADGVRKIVHEITVIIGQSKEVEDNAAPRLPPLAAPAPIYLIEESKPRETFAAELDDEIPF